MKNINFTKDKFAIVGIGDTGLSILRYLQYKNANIVKVFDTRNNPPNQDLLPTKTKLYTGKLDLNNFIDIDVVVISPGISIYEPVFATASKNNITIIGDVELFALEVNNWPTKIIGITGSNGKTTVTSLLGNVLQSSGYSVIIAGNIGKPVLDTYLDYRNISSIPQFIVLELSSFQLESIYTLRLDIATVLNISEDHLDRYDSLLHYAYTKSNIFKNAHIQVLNYDDKFVMAMSDKSKQKVTFGLKAPADYYLEDGRYLCHRQTKLLSCSEVGLIGVHNYLNILAVLSILGGLNIDISHKIKQIIYQFGGVEYRMQKINTISGITFICDSKGTNVGATNAGISGLNSFVNLILGGDGKGQDFLPLRDIVINKCRSVAIIGVDKFKILAVLDGIDTVNIKTCDSLYDAVLFCYNNAIMGDYVVLSPACASFDMFDNYKHRAKVFINIVDSLNR